VRRGVALLLGEFTPQRVMPQFGGLSAQNFIKPLWFPVQFIHLTAAELVAAKVICLSAKLDHH